MIDTEKDKLKQKIEWLKQHLNMGRTPEQLDADFEVWYKDDYKKQQDAETLASIKQAVQKESVLDWACGYHDHDPQGFIYKGTICLSRVCTLQAFVNAVRLKSVDNHTSYKIVFESASGCKLAWCEIHGLNFDTSDAWCKYSMRLIAESGRVTDTMGNKEIWIRPYTGVGVGDN